MDGARGRMNDSSLLEELLATRKEVAALTEEAAVMRERAAAAAGQKERMTSALQEAREQINALREEVDKLTAPPNTYGVYLTVNEHGTANILSQRSNVKVNMHPATKAETLNPAQELLLT